MLTERIQNELQLLGLDAFEHPIFYNCSYGIRFEIGVGDVYGEEGTPRKEYVENALCRAITIYNFGIKFPGVLVWEVFTQNGKETQQLKSLFLKRISPVFPQEESVQNLTIEEEHIKIKQTQFFWNLKESQIPMDKLFREIILGDLGGLNVFVSSVYLFDVESHVMFHLYDDRGLDIVSHDKNTLIPLYRELDGWILDYDRKQIDEMFIG